MTLAAIINTIVSLVVLGLGVWLVLAGAVGLALGILGDALFIRVSIAMILLGLVLFFAGSIAAIRVIV